MLAFLYHSLLLVSILFTTDTVAVRITNITTSSGCVRLAVFGTAEDFEQEKSAVFDQVIPLTTTRPIRLQLPLSGAKHYGIALYHDLNNNGKLDRNGLGIPREPYAFSNNPAAKWQAPGFSDIAFVPNQLSEGELVLKLMSWSER